MKSNFDREPDVLQPPPPQVVKAQRKAAKLTQAQAAALVHASLRSWQQWEAESTSDSSRRMHPAFWELFLLKTGGPRVAGAINATAADPKTCF